MKKLAVMTCDKLKNQCSGTNCFEAFGNREKAFDIYKNEDVQFGAFFSCNGCGKDLNESMDYMFGQLHLKGVKTIHMALCIDVECHRYEYIEQVIKDNGFDVVRGSH